MKKSLNFIIILLTIILTGIIFSCTSTPPMSEENKAFIEETRLSLVIPMRFYTWIKVDNSNKVMPDIINGILNFAYDASGDFLLKTETKDNKIYSIWGNQLLSQDEENRQFVFTPFIAAIYALEEGKDPLNIAFQSLEQILADNIYKEYEKKLINVFQEGIKEYRTGGIAWENYKKDNFLIMDKTIIIK